MPDLNMKFVRTFLIQVEEKSTTKTAGRLGISKASVLGHVRKLEEVVGQRLLERRFPPNKAETGRTQLTEAGRAFLPQATKVMDAHDRMLGDAPSNQDPREANRIITLRLLELALAALRHDLSDDDRQRLYNGLLD